MKLLNKSAMFGLDAMIKNVAILHRAKRQTNLPRRGERQRINLIQDLSCLKLKKAAMFGLDARIALAIFGALSVISGASLYGAIQQSKAKSTLALMREAAKAIESFYLDAGSLMTERSTYELQGFELVEETGNNWNGPYISDFYRSSSWIINGKFSIHIFYLDKAVDFGGNGDDTVFAMHNTAECESGTTNLEDCFVWVYINIQDSEEVAKIIDELVDNSDGDKAGNFRWEYDAGAPNLKYRYLLNTGINYKDF